MLVIERNLNIWYGPGSELNGISKVEEKVIQQNMQHLFASFENRGRDHNR